MTWPRDGRGAGRGEAGSAVVELIWLGLLLMIPLVYVMISIITVQRSAFGATEAARAAGRAFILAPDVETARARAFAAAQISMRDESVSLSPDELQINCRPTPRSCLQPGSSVEVRLHLQVALPLMPAMFGESAASIAVEAEHREPFGAYRETG